MPNKDRMTIREFVGGYLAGEFDAPDRDTQIKAGWYDWFCKDSSLKGKTNSLAKKLISILKSEKIDIDKHYVFFKNNCPMAGNLYDDFRICDIETGDVIYTITPSCGHDSEKGKANVWGKENGFEKPLTTGSWSAVKKFFLYPDEEV